MVFHCAWYLSMVFYRLILGFFGPFWENGGYVTIDVHLPSIYEGRNNYVLNQFGWNLIVKVKMEGIMVGL